MENSELTTNEALLLIGALYVESVKLQQENMELKDELHLQNDYATAEIDRLRALLQENQTGEPEDPWHDEGNATNHRLSQCGPHCAETQADGYSDPLQELNQCLDNAELACARPARTESGAIPLPAESSTSKVEAFLKAVKEMFPGAQVIEL